MLRTFRFPIPILSVGGLEAGGTGKTPIARLLLRALLNDGKRPGLLTRGYGRTEKGLVRRQPGEALHPHRLGDEPVMMSAGLDIPIVASADRVAGVQALIEMGCDVAVLDDGFAHRRLERSLNIVAMRAEAPFGNGRLIPRGRLRESPRGLNRADLLWLHHRQTSRPSPSLPSNERWSQKPTILSRTKLEWLHDEHPGGPPPTPVLLVSGIARPEDLSNSCHELGLQTIGHCAFSDHHRYTQADIHLIEEKACEGGAGSIVTTAKDWAKIKHLDLTATYRILDTSIEIISGLELLAQKLGVSPSSLAFAQTTEENTA